MKKSLLALAIAGLAIASAPASAATRNVAVYGDRFDIGIINTFYDSLADTDSNVIGGLSACNLAGVQLL